MTALRISPALEQYVEDELLRAPLLFDQLAEGLIEHTRRKQAKMSVPERQTSDDIVRAVLSRRATLADRYLQSLREEVNRQLNEPGPTAAKPLPTKASLVLALVEEDQVALDVELSHTIRAIADTAEHELRELRTYIAALVGDLDVAEDHNPFRPEVHARALWAAAQALSLSRGHQVAFVRYASQPLADLLQQAYAGACSRLEDMGIEPAAYRTMILPSGTRRTQFGMDSSFGHDLQHMRDAMPAWSDTKSPMTFAGQLDPGPRRDDRPDPSRKPPSQADRQGVELVGRLFDALALDKRVPADVATLIARLRGPAMRLALRDPAVLDGDDHPMWAFVHLFAYEAEMAPSEYDPERIRWLRLGQQMIGHIAAEKHQRGASYRAALERLEEFLRQRLQRRCAALASQIGALQKFEARPEDEPTVPGALEGVLDFQALDTVPAALMPAPLAPASQQGQLDPAEVAWLDGLRPGQWVRMLIQGGWVHAQLLWPGERRKVWLFGDGASDATWAVRRGALLKMHAGGLVKTLKVRSLVGSAAARVQEQMAALGVR